MTRSLLTGMSLIAFCAASAAHAQTAPQTTPTPAMTDQTHAANVENGTPAQAASGAGEGLADIIVTATKTETTLQKTPQAITAIDGNALDKKGVSTIQQLEKLVGGLRIERNAGASSIYIRGIGARVLAPQDSPAVAFSVDGVYYSRNTGLSQTLFDLSRIEVVKGPQGTLYGRNATGGGVNVITNHPRLGVRSLDGEIEVGDYQAVRTIGAVNLPIGDTMAIRFAGETTYHTGYLSDGRDDENTKAGRVSFLYSPGSDFSIYLSGDYAHIGGTGTGTVPVGPGSNSAVANGPAVLGTRFVVPGHPFVGPGDPRIANFINTAAPAQALPVPFPGGPYCVGAPLAGFPDAPGSPAIPFCATPIGVPPIGNDDFIDDDVYGGNITVQGDLGFGQLTAVGGYRATNVNTLQRLDIGAQLQIQKIDQYTAEVRLASKPHSGRLQWLIGGFYLREKQNSDFTISRNNGAIPNPIPAPGSPLPATRCFAPLDPDGPGPAPASTTLCLVNAAVIQRSFRIIDPSDIDETYAAFGQMTFSVTDQLRVTGGIRYTHEQKQQDNASVTNIYVFPAGVTTTYPTNGSANFHNTAYRAGVEFDVAPRVLLYANVSTAFHAGGLNPGVAQGPFQPYVYKPENITAYIAGIKSRFLDNRLQINLEGFWLDYKNYQQGRLGQVNDGSFACSTLMIAQACPTTLRTDNSASARIKGFEGDFVFTPMENTTLNLNVVYDDGKFGKFIIPAFPFGTTDYSHLRLANSPPWTVTGGITQAFPLGNGGRIIADASSQYKSGSYLYYIHIPGNYQKGFTRTDLGLTYEAPDAKYSLTAFVRNVENKATISQGSSPDSSTGAVFTSLNPPRTYGVNLKVHF